MWSCPACSTLLLLENRHWRCSHGHSFDIAKEGYVNLLLANQKHSSEPGDNKLMINGRRRFLEQGYYAPMAQQIAKLLVTHSRLKNMLLHDAGCGEGYYLQKVVESLRSNGIEVQGCGNDISKVAIQKASKQYSGLHFAVASSFNLPKASESIDAVMQIFAPASAEEIFRILKPDGFWLQVTPGPSHLLELKQSLYTEPALHEVSPQAPTGFIQRQQESLTLALELGDIQSRQNLLEMTPFYWTAKVAEKLNIVDSLNRVTAEFIFTVMQKDCSTVDRDAVSSPTS
jgi:23S rRNA (guanine745-N1)-methyltransferase